MNVTAQQRDRAVGVLLGTAAGDALGAGYEFTYPSAATKIDMIGGGTFAWEPGEWTDDTAMALAIASVAATGVDIGRGRGLDAVAAEFVRWYDSNPKDIGNQTRNVLGRRAGDAATMQAHARALTGRKAGNGSLMRTAPVALAYLDDGAGCLEAAAQISALTHDDPTAEQACRLWSHAIRHAVLYGTFDGVRGFLKIASPEVADFWRPLLDEAERGTPADFANNGWVVHALQTAWWAITTTSGAGEEHLRGALEAAVRAGGDTDTTAAIAGGLLGARWGAAAIPARWRRMLHGWPGHTADDLIRLALDTVNGGPRGTDSRRRIRVVQGDITTLRVDALVNPTDPNFSGDGGVDRAVHRAGGPAIRAACDTLRATTLPHGLSVGAAVATTAGNLPATWIVHTVGPRYSHSEDRTAQLRAAYTRSLAAAEAVGARTVAFPLIAGGAAGWPIDDAVRHAVAALTEAHTALEEVTLVAADARAAALLRREVG